jgi:hypothetical protein
MKFRLTIAAVLAVPALGACETLDPDMVGAALSLYSDIAYLNGDCPFGLHKYHDSEGHHHCWADDDSPRHQDGTGHHHDE